MNIHFNIYRVVSYARISMSILIESSQAHKITEGFHVHKCPFKYLQSDRIRVNVHFNDSRIIVDV